MGSTEAEDFMNNYDKDDQEDHNDKEIQEENFNIRKFKCDIYEVLEEVKKLKLTSHEKRNAPTDFTDIPKKNGKNKERREMYGHTKERANQDIGSVSQSQRKVAEKLFNTIVKNYPNLSSSSIRKYKYFDVFILIPLFKSLERQTVDRLVEYINFKRKEEPCFLQDLETGNSYQTVMRNVMRNVGRKNKEGREAQKFDEVKNRLLKEKDTFFLLIHDEGDIKVFYATSVFCLLIQ